MGGRGGAEEEPVANWACLSCWRTPKVSELLETHQAEKVQRPRAKAAVQAKGKTSLQVC